MWAWDTCCPPPAQVVRVQRAPHTHTCTQTFPGSGKVSRWHYSVVGVVMDKMSLHLKINGINQKNVKRIYKRKWFKKTKISLLFVHFFHVLWLEEPPSWKLSMSSIWTHFLQMPHCLDSLCELSNFTKAIQFYNQDQAEMRATIKTTYSNLLVKSLQ